MRNDIFFGFKTKSVCYENWLVPLRHETSRSSAARNNNDFALVIGLVYVISWLQPAKYHRDIPLF